MTKFQKQVEVQQGTKKLDSVKGVQALEFNEMRETEGGIAPAVVVAVAVLYLVGTTCGLLQGKRLNGMP